MSVQTKSLEPVVKEKTLQVWGAPQITKLAVLETQGGSTNIGETNTGFYYHGHGTTGS